MKGIMYVLLDCACISIRFKAEATVVVRSDARDELSEDRSVV